jgi:flagellar motor switch protein FliN/FliY
MNQSSVDALLQQLEDGNKAATDATSAVQQAAATASEIAGDIQSTKSPAGASPVPSPKAAPAAVIDAAAAALAHEAESPPPVEAPPPALPRELQRLLAIEVPIIVRLGSRRLTVAEVMRFAVGAIIEFNKSSDEDMDLLANNKSIGKGQAVKVGENFGIKITTISPVRDTIRKLGAA